MTHSDSTPLYLVDGSGFIFRAYHALPMMTRADGTPVNAVYGFCTMLHKLLADLGAKRIAVIFDAGRKTFRNEIYPDYKAHRPPAPEDLIPQFPLIREATEAFGLLSLEVPNYEADDLIAAYATEAVSQGIPVRIVSSDKDLMQLVRPGVELFDPMKSKSLGEADVVDKFGVTPDKVIDVQSLAGDSSDGVPGVPGIGLKIAAQLILEYGSLENLLADAANIKQNKRRENLINFADQARISKLLVTLDPKAPLPLPLDDLNASRHDPENLAAFLRAQGFRSLIARLGKQEEPTPPSSLEEYKSTPTLDSALIDTETNYVCIQDEKTLQSWVQKARDKGIVAIDTETTSLTPSTTEMVGISMAFAPGEACYIPLGHKDPEGTVCEEGGFSFGEDKTPPQLSIAACVRVLQDFLADSSVLKIGHNLKFDMQVLGQHGLALKSFDDTMLISYVLGAGAHGHGLDELAMRHFQHKMISFSEATGSGRKKITFDRVPLDVATPYAAEDADYTLRLWMVLKPELTKQKLTQVYESLERPLIPIIADMEKEGIRIDPQKLKIQSGKLSQRQDILQQEIFNVVGHPFNIGSPKQLGEVLFGELCLDGGKRGKTGAFGTSHDVLEPLADNHEIVQKILDWRGIAKLKSTYTDALPNQIDPKTGRVHTSYSMVGAATGRLSSTDPNLQNIPIRTEDGRAIREAFIAREGFILLAVDYSQIELRLAAEMAGIKALQQAFQDGVDIHALTASQVFGIPLDELPAAKRREAKAINFGIIYGISGFGLAKQLGCSPGEANSFITAYLDRFHELRDWMESTKEFAKNHGYVETLFGRRIHISNINDKNPMRRKGSERQAINAPLQGTAADIIKRAMIRIPDALKQEGLDAKLLLQVHDELVFDVPLDQQEKTAACVKKIMEDAPKPLKTLTVPLVAEAGFGTHWGNAH